MKLEVNIPTDLSEIKLRQWQKFIDIADNSNDDEFVAQKMIETFCNIELSDIVKMNYTDVIDLYGHFTQMFNTKHSFVQRFKLNDVEFGFIPNLEQITFEEFVDLESNLANNKTMHNAMAVMYRPIVTKSKDKYTIERYETSAKYDEVMKFAPLNVVLGANVFFWTLRNELLSLLPTYLETEMSKMNTRSSTNLPKDGDGINQSMDLLKVILPNMTKSLECPYLNALPILHLRNKKTKSKTVN
jgi:hypothetical protein